MSNNIILKDEENIRVFDEGKMVDLLDQIEGGTIRTRFYINEAKLQPLDNVPILIDQLRRALKISLDVSDDAVKETMETTGLVMNAPTGKSGNYAVYPVASSASMTLNARAGFVQASCLRYGSSRGRIQMAPTERASVLNSGMSCYSTRALSIIRDEKIRAVLSGDDGDYSVIPANECFAAIRDTLKSLSNWNVGFHYGDVNHEYTSFSLVIKSKDLLSEIEKAFSRSVLKWDNTYFPVIKVCTSDIGFSGVNIYPMIVNKMGNEIPLGVVLKTSHKGKKTIDDVIESTKKVFSSFREASTNIEKLGNYSVLNLAGLVKCVAKAAKLPKVLTFKMIDEFVARYGENVYGVDVFFLLTDILDAWYQEGKISSYLQLVSSETIARLLFEDRIKEIDYPFEWDV